MFAVVLIVVELGLFLGFLTTTSGLIDRSGADLSITASRVPYIEQGVPFSERKLYTVLGTPGVAIAAKYLARFSQWQRLDGGQESVRVVEGARVESVLLCERFESSEPLQHGRAHRAVNGVGR